MSEAAVDRVTRVRMSWEDYLALPEKAEPDWVKAEWVDGEVLLMSPVFPEHGRAVMRLGRLLEDAFPELECVTEVGLTLPRNRVRAPDLMLLRDWNAGAMITEKPVIAVEVLSLSTRGEDTVRKSTEYAEGGVGQYWLVDPDHRAIDVYRNDEGAWTLLLHLDDDNPSGSVEVAGEGSVHLELNAVLRSP